MNIDLDNPGSISKEDVRQARLVEAMRQHQGFPVLVEFWNLQREMIIQDAKKAAKMKDAAVAQGYWMMLDGFDKACSMVEKIAARAEKEDEMRNLEKEGRQHAQE